MKDTPRTNAAAGYPDGSGCWKYNDLGFYVDADFARELERESIGNANFASNTKYENTILQDKINRIKYCVTIDNESKDAFIARIRAIIADNS